MARLNSGLRSRLLAGRQGQAGISLISVLVALALLATTAIAVSRLIVTGSAGSRLTRENFVAIQIAREGLELIRTQRDNNWFKVPTIDWTTDICNNAPDLIFDADMARNNDPPVKTTTDAPENILSRKDDGELVHSVDNTEPTIFSRVITVNCADPTFIEVTSKVTWRARGVSRSLDIKEKLFNWFPLASATGGKSTTSPTPTPSPTPTTTPTATPTPPPGTLSAPSDVKVIPAGSGFMQISWKDNSTDENGFLVHVLDSNNQHVQFSPYRAVPNQQAVRFAAVSGATYRVQVAAIKTNSSGTIIEQSAWAPNPPPLTYTHP